MALKELHFQNSPNSSNGLRNDRQTRIFRTTLLSDMPYAGQLAQTVSTSFPSNWIVEDRNYTFDGYENGDTNTVVYIVTVTAVPIQQVVHGNAGIFQSYEDTESFDTSIDYERAPVPEADDPDKFKTFTVPRLLFTQTKFTDKPIKTGGGLFTTDPVTPLIDRIGRVNASSNDPFVGANAGEWMCVGISSRRATKRLWEYTAEYKHSGRFWNPSNKTVERRNWSDISGDIIFETGTIGI